MQEVAGKIAAARVVTERDSNLMIVSASGVVIRMDVSVIRALGRTTQGTLVQKLAETGIVASNRYDGLRISFHVYNTMDDVQAVVEILKKNIDLLVLAPAVASHD